MKRMLEFSDTKAGYFVAVVISWCLVILTVATATAIIVAVIGPSWAEQCVTSGGEYQKVLNQAGTYDEKCDMPEGRK